MARHEPRDRTGCVIWPSPTGSAWQDTGEGGMTVYAVWPIQPYPDPFITCSEGASIAMSVHEPVVGALVSATNKDADPMMWREFQDEVMLAAIVLGSSGGSWWQELGDEGEHFRAELADLTDDGRAIVEGLNRLYGRPAVLLTMLDT